MKSLNLTTQKRIAGAFISLTPNQLRRLADCAEDALRRQPNEAVEIADGVVLFFEPDYDGHTATTIETPQLVAQ